MIVMQHVMSVMVQPIMIVLHVTKIIIDIFALIPDAILMMVTMKIIWKYQENVLMIFAKDVLLIMMTTVIVV